MLWQGILYAHVMLSVSANIVMDLETFQGAGPGNIVPRSNASQGVVVHLLKDNIIRYEMCIHSPIDMQINNIVYSNDAGNVGDVISFDIDGNLIGSFNTAQPSEMFSSAWNDFQGSGVIGDRFWLDYGNHMLTLRVTQADNFGVELDTIELDIGNNTLTSPSLACDVHCFDDINFKSSDIPNDIDDFQVRQFSRPSVCSEEENIKVAIYHDTAKNFDIKATRPKYASCSNNKEADYRGCKLASPAWVFNKVRLVSSNSIEEPRASLLVDAEGAIVRVAVTFDMSGFSTTRGQGESRTAGIVFVRLGRINGPVRTHLSYKGKSGTLIRLQEFTFTQEILQNIWNLPDDIWGLNNDNNIILEMINVEPSMMPMYIEEIKLEKRQQPSETFIIHDDGMFVWEGIHRDSWWLSHQQTLSINVQYNGSNTVYDDVENLRVYMKKPYDDGYAQIFVIHNDGHCRIQPVTSHGMDWTPFGSSFIIGPNIPEDLRPYASIKLIELDPVKMKMTAKYHDDSSVVMKILPSPTETLVKLRQLNVPHDRHKRAVLTFLSMWIEDGYSNVDHLALNNVEFSVLNRWDGYLNGTRANFYRKCISRLNTQSPDMEVVVRRQTLINDLD